MTPVEVPQPKPVWMGVVLCFLLHLSLVVLGPVGMVALAGVGIAQAIYVIPAFIIAKNKNEPNIAKGLLIGAGITFLLNATCFGIVLTSMSRGGFH